MRGARQPSGHSAKNNRIIPAYAGSTRSAGPAGAAIGDHPRVCGEHLSAAMAEVNEAGSSPRMRGAPDTKPISQHIIRIIPAYAGSTLHGLSDRWAQEDHPRVCGEHQLLDVSCHPHNGSSPRMRGAPRARPLPAWRQWIIPAYAGSTSDLRTLTAIFGDHPRVCGEHTLLLGLLAVLLGSSPRMRGARTQVRNYHHVYRIIPAYAGSTSQLSIAAPHRQDHPRVCGEHTIFLPELHRISGSSPRMRGALEAFLHFQII